MICIRCEKAAACVACENFGNCPYTRETVVRTTSAALSPLADVSKNGTTVVTHLVESIAPTFDLEKIKGV